MATNGSVSVQSSLLTRKQSAKQLLEGPQLSITLPSVHIGKYMFSDISNRVFVPACASLNIMSNATEISGSTPKLWVYSVIPHFSKYMHNSKTKEKPFVVLRLSF